jgi:hypothetical protein
MYVCICYVCICSICSIAATASLVLPNPELLLLGVSIMYVGICVYIDFFGLARSRCGHYECVYVCIMYMYLCMNKLNT